MLSLLSRQAERLCGRRDLSRLAPRARSQLAFVEKATPAGSPLLLDTGVYIHQLRNKTPPILDALIGARIVNHSTVAMQEMLHTIGVLDPADPRTKDNAAAIRGLLDAVPSRRCSRLRRRSSSTPRCMPASCAACGPMPRTDA